MKQACCGGGVIEASKTPACCGGGVRETSNTPACCGSVRDVSVVIGVTTSLDAL